MALIEIYHVVADFYAVDPDWTVAILEGRIVKLDTVGSNAYVGLATATTPIGIAGDTLSNSVAATPYSATLTIGAYGPVTNPTARTRSTENRVSDMFNETLASGLMTVYHSGGKFASDQYLTSDTFTIGSALYSNAVGQYTVTDAGSARRVGTVVAAPRAYPSGVPGTDTADGSTSLGTYLTFILDI